MTLGEAGLVKTSQLHVRRRDTLAFFRIESSSRTNQDQRSHKNATIRCCKLQPKRRRLVVQRR